MRKLNNTLTSFQSNLGLSRKALYVFDYNDYYIKTAALLNKKAGTYGIYNPFSRRIYIGSSVNIHKRLKNHFIDNKHSNIALQNAFKKYGMLNFQVIIFDILDITNMSVNNLREKLIEMENSLLSVLNSTGNLYNIAKLAYSRLGVIHTNKTKERISLALMGHKVSKETRLLIGKASANRVYSDVSKKRMSESAKKRTDRHIHDKLITEKYGKTVQLYNLHTKETHIFNSINKGARFLKVHPSTVQRAAERPNNIYKKLWQISYIKKN